MTTHTFKVLLLGPKDCGKRTFIIRHLDGGFVENFDKTDKTDKYLLHFDSNIGDIKVEVHLTPKYCDDYDILMLMFDTSDIRSFEAVKIIEKEAGAKQSLRINHSHILVGTKVDKKRNLDHNDSDSDDNSTIQSTRGVFPREIRDFLRTAWIDTYVEISTKSMYNLEKPWLAAIRLALKNEHIVLV